MAGSSQSLRSAPASRTSTVATAARLQERSGALLRAVDVVVEFGGLRALDGVGLAVMPGEIVSLIGPNGAGKTTLFGVISGLVEPRQGTVWFDGDDISRLPVRARRHRGIARTFQLMELFEDLTVVENILVTRELERLSAWRLLSGCWRASAVTSGEVADAEEIAALLGLGAVVDANVSSLSTGLRRLVELGRVIMTDARLIMLDEPSAGLDTRESARLGAAIADLRDAGGDGQAVLLVEHDMTVALGLADYVYVLDFGRLIAEGTPEEIRANETVHAAYLGKGL